MNDVSSPGVLGATDQRYHDATRTLIMKYRLMGLIPAVIVGILLWFVHPIAAILGLIVIAAGWLAFTSTRLKNPAATIVAGLPTQIVRREDQPRLWNLVDGLCITSGVPQPEIRMLAQPTLNALVVVDNNETIVVITQGIVDSLDRIELEAVLAHLLMRVKDGSAEYYTMVLRLHGASSRTERLLDATFGTHWSLRHDLAAVSLTKYPPGMIGALSTIQEVGSTVDATPEGTSGLWFADPSAANNLSNDTVLQSVSFRQAVLAEL